MTASAADFTQAAADVREAIRSGTRLDGKQLLRILDVIKAGAGATLNDAIDIMDTNVADLNTDYGAQMAILAAFTGSDPAADIVAAIATAKGVLDPRVSTVVVHMADIDSAAPVDVSVPAATVADGSPFAGS